MLILLNFSEYIKVKKLAKFLNLKGMIINGLKVSISPEQNSRPQNDGLLGEVKPLV
jgi:hypothetical protein